MELPADNNPMVHHVKKPDRRPRPSDGWRGRVLMYGFAVAMTGLTLLARLSLPAASIDRPLLVIFFLPILFSAYFGGLGPGLVATAITAVGAEYYLLPPFHSFAFANTMNFTQWLILVASGVLASVLNEALHRSRRRADTSQILHAVTLASIGDAVITTDEKGRVTFLNGAAEHLTGWTNATAAGQPLPTVFHIINEKTRELAEDPVEKVFRTGMVVGLANHTVLIARDGREFVIDDSGAPIRGADGTIIGVVLVFRDNTEKKRAEDALHESQALYHSLVDQMPAGVFRKDAEGRYVFVNSYFCRLRNALPDSFLGKLPAELPASEDSFKVAAADHHAQIMQTGQPIVVLDKYLRADGETLYFQVVKSPVFNAEGKITGSQGVLLDVTERKLAAEKIAHEQARFKLIFDTVPIGIALHTVQPNGQITRTINDAHLRICGLTRAQHDEPDIYLKITHPDDRALQQRFTDQVKAGSRQQFSLEKRYLHPDDKTVWVNFSYQRETYSDGATEELTTVTDITERKLAEAELRWRTALLEAQLESAIDGILVVNSEGKKIHQNRRIQELWKIPRAFAEDKDDTAQLNYCTGQTKNPQQFVEKVVYLYAHPDEVSRDEIELVDGTVLDRYSAPVKDQAGKYYGRIWTFRDITERRRAETLTKGHSQIMEMIANDAPTAETLDTLLRLVENQEQEMLCSILLLDADGCHLRHCAAPSLPAEYTKAIDGGPSAPALVHAARQPSRANRCWSRTSPPIRCGKITRV